MNDRVKAALATIKRTVHQLSPRGITRHITHELVLFFILPLFPPLSRTLYFYPEWPLPMYLTWAVCRKAKIHIKAGVGKTTMLFADTSNIDPATLPAGHESWINGRCIDITKVTVARAYEKVFKHKLLIDPLTYRGAAVRKSNLNATHDGFVVKCPIKNPLEGYVYQRLIDNTVGDGAIEDATVVVAGDELPLVYIKRRHIHNRFSSSDLSAETKLAKDVFTPAEIKKILGFAREIGLDFGAIDTLRDRDSKVLYIVDANPTSMSPPIRLSLKKRYESISIIARSFEKLVNFSR